MHVEENQFSRRQILEMMGLTTFGVVLPHAPSSPKHSDSSQENPSIESLGISVADRVRLMADPNFFGKFQKKSNGEMNTKKIGTQQFDDDEYPGMEPFPYMNNTCALAALTTLGKMLGYCQNLVVPHYYIATTYNKLKDLSFTDIRGYKSKYVLSNAQMSFAGLPSAVKLLNPVHITKVEVLSPDYGARYTRIIPQKLWSAILQKAQAICEAGGLTILGGVKFASPEYNAGHIVLATDVREDGSGLVVDSRAAKDGLPGTTQRVMLNEYFESVVDKEAPLLGKQPGLISVIGVSLS